MLKIELWPQLIAFWLLAGVLICRLGKKELSIIDKYS